MEGIAVTRNDAGRTAEVVVIGGGVVGICTALYLQRSGRRVTVVEPSEPGWGASGHNGGVFNVGECIPTGTPGVLRGIPRMLADPQSALVFRYRYLPRLAPWLVRFIRASAPDRAETISASLQRLTAHGMDGYRPLIDGTEAGTLVSPGGLLLAYVSERSFARDAYGRGLRERRADNFEVLGDAEITRLDPVLAGRFCRAVYRPAPYFTFESERFVGLLAKQFVDQGGVIHRSAAQRIVLTGGRARGVATDSGEITGDSLVIAAGAWSRRFTRQLGFDVPLEAERGYGLYLPHGGLRFRRPVIVCDNNISLSNVGSGVQITGVDELASADAAARYPVTGRLIQGAKIAFTDLDTRDAVPWMHCRPSMPDSLPVIGTAPGHPNVYLAFGHGHKGLGLAGITGSLVRQLIDGEPPSVDLEPYSPLRFPGRWRRRAAAAAG
jgi:glycine/D-amino acid oxidase-like deaminating enzyme